MDLTAGRPTEYIDRRFRALNHREASIAAKEFVTCTFRQCAFQEALLRACRFIECRFVRCDFSLARIHDCTFREVLFEDCRVLGLNWTEAAAVKFLRFERCVLNHSVFMGLDLRRTYLARCVAREVDLTDCDLSDADCRHTDFSGSRFLRTNLTRADFRHATGYAIAPGLNTLKKAKFSLPDAIGLLYGLDITLDEPDPENDSAAPP